MFQNNPPCSSLGFISGGFLFLFSDLNEKQCLFHCSAALSSGLSCPVGHVQSSPHLTFLILVSLQPFCPPRFRVGFKHAFRWCPFVSAAEYEGLEMKSARYLQTQSSMYKVSRIETTVSLAVGAAEEELEESKKGKRLSVDMTSNGSSRSDSKTVSESFSFYSNTLT